MLMGNLLMKTLSVLLIQVISRYLTSAVVMVFGHAVNLMKEKEQDVLRERIELLNIQIMTPRNFSMICH